MNYEAPVSMLENPMGDVIQASQGGNIYLPDEDFQD